MILQASRFIQVNATLLRYGLDEIFFKTYAVPWFIRYPMKGLFFFAHGWKRKKQTRAVRIRLALESLGTIFVKFGQALSTRRDLLPEDIANELAKLQDKVPPFNNALAYTLIEKALEGKIDDLFVSFEREPIASASMAQVYGAVLKQPDSQTEEEVVVKVLRPDIIKQIKRDIALLYWMARLFEKLRPSQSSYLHLVEVVEEYEKTILNELDLVREAANASQLKRNFNGSDLLYVPKVYWPLCHQNVMVMERVRGIPVNDIAALKAHDINFKELSERGVEIFFTQVFEHNFFHADMHPGNIFVSTENAGKPKYLGVDFGIMGSLSDEDQRYLAENFLAFFNNDYRRVAELHLESGWIDESVRMDDFTAAIRTICEPNFQRPLNEISFGFFLVRLFRTARAFNMEVQPQLILLQKTLLNIEGLGRELYPDLDLWQTAKPFLEKWVAKRSGLRYMVDELRHNTPRMLMSLSNLPSEIHASLERSKKIEQESAQRNHQLLKAIQRLQYMVALTAAVVATALILLCLR